MEATPATLQAPVIGEAAAPDQAEVMPQAPIIEEANVPPVAIETPAVAPQAAAPSQVEPVVPAPQAPVVEEGTAPVAIETPAVPPQAPVAGAVAGLAGPTAAPQAQVQVVVLLFILYNLSNPVLYGFHSVIFSRSLFNNSCFLNIQMHRYNTRYRLSQMVCLLLFALSASDLIFFIDSLICWR